MKTICWSCEYSRHHCDGKLSDGRKCECQKCEDKRQGNRSSLPYGDKDLFCPFCGDGGPQSPGGGFDLIGLKSHLINHCDKFEEVPRIGGPAGL